MSSRFVAGMSVDDVLSACDRVNHENIAATLGSLVEVVTTEAEAQKSADIYHQLLDAIEARKLNANVSVKLSQVGMDFDPALAERIVGEMVAHAAAVHSFVRIDMEGSPYTEATIAMTERLSAKYPGSVGTVLQAYLFRTESSTERLLGQGIRPRLCKGIKEGPDVAFPSKDRRGRKLRQADEAHGDLFEFTNRQGRLLRHSHPRRSHRRPDARLRQRPQGRQTRLRIPDALRRPPRPPAPPRRRGLRRPRLHPLRARVVPLLHAPPGRTSS